ncbi:hypothetical protein E4U09_001406 [Claviceps aff. purpurea]|uniref:Uncharacterized protein n=1 Tax=Claviceps aff. purpurea TaxID=1967640 RepID=A0A9P7QHL6_9HYPO|nr:hypothetical protein E4U09_001406 [Claviceps aff. purpurea]
MCYTNVHTYIHPDGCQETLPISHLCPASIEGQLCPRHNIVTLAPIFANQVPHVFRNPASGYSAPFMGQFPPPPPYNPHIYPPSPPHNPYFSASGPRHPTDEKSRPSKHPAKEGTKSRPSTSRRPTAREERSHQRRDKARIVIDIDMADDSSYEEEPAEGKSRKTSPNHCDHCNYHCHSGDEKVPHQRRGQRDEPERPKPPPTPGSSPPPFHSGPSNGAKAAQDRQEIEELRETVRRLEREKRERIRQEREWEAQRRRSEERSSRPRRRTTAGGCDCDGYYEKGDYRWY